MMSDHGTRGKAAQLGIRVRTEAGWAGALGCRERGALKTGSPDVGAEKTTGALRLTAESR